MSKTRKPLDWEAIEKEFRAGQLSVMEIGRQHGCSHAAINKRAKKHGWTRDLTEEVRKATRAKVAASVSAKVSIETSRETAQKIVDEASDRGARVIQGHITTAARLKRLAHASMTLLEQHLGLPTDTTCEPGDALAKALDPSIMKNPGNLFIGKSDGVANMLRAVTDMSERVQRLERQALNLDDTPPPQDNDFVSTLTKARERARAAREAATAKPAHE